MLSKEKGTCSGSDLYFQTPSENALSFLYYMTSCGYYYTNYDYCIERQNYHNFLLFCIKEGRLSVTSNGRTLVAHTGQIGFVDCHHFHEYHTIGNTEFVWLHLDGANSRDFYEHILEHHGGFVFDLPNSKEIYDRIFELVYIWRNEQRISEIRLSYKLYGLLSTLLDHAPIEQENNNSPLAAALDFIQQHYHESISLTDIAAAVNMSIYYFSRQFKKEFGYSPHDFLILTRMNRAKHLLKTTDLPIKVIAQMVGYRNVATFTNAFTARIGLSPSLFRKYPI